MRTDIDQRTGLEVLDWDECLALLGRSSLGRIAVVMNGRPLIFPVNFALDGDAIVLRTDPGTKLYGARNGPVATPRYLREVMWPAAKKGMAKAARGDADFAMCVMPLVATAADRAGLAERIQDVRARVAFYASTPTYLAAFETDGHAETAKQLQALARAQRWEEMPALVDDAMLDTYAVIGTYDEIAEKLRARYSGLATHLEFTMALATPGEVDALRAILAELKRP